MFLKFVCVLCLFVPIISSNIKEELNGQSFLYTVASISGENIFEETFCKKHLKEFTKGIEAKELWALKMLDASGQQEPGYLFGHTLWLGSLSQCRDISLKHENSPFKIDFITAVLNHNNTMQLQFRIPINANLTKKVKQHPLVKRKQSLTNISFFFPLFLPEYLHIGLCVPKSCSPEELTRYLDRMLDKKLLKMQQIYPVYLNVSGVKSLKYDKTYWIQDTMIITTMFLIILSIVLCLAGTCYDILYYQPYLKILKDDSGNNSYQPSIVGRILVCYSFHTNMRSIFSTTFNVEPNSTNLPFIHGIKAWFMLYIVLLHGVLYQNYFTDNAYMAYRMAEMLVNQILSNASYSVDTYFCLGGFLISYIFYKSHKDKKPYTVLGGIKAYFKMIINRCIRLLPPYIATILITYTLWQISAHEYPLINRNRFEKVETACFKYWWRNLLFISTFYPREEMCMSWSWYLSNDMQFYIVNCLLLLLSTVYLKQTLFFMSSLPVISIICGGVTSYIHKYVPTLEEQILQLEIMYDPFLIRMGPYFVGVNAGYYINKWNNSIPLKKSTITKISYASFLTIIFIIHGVYTRDNLPIAYIAIYMGLSRTLWGICIAWLLITCVSGNAELINNFLSLKVWIPISRLTYSIFLIHPIIISMFGFTGERGIHISYVSMIQSAVGTFAISVIASLFLSLLFESPYVLLVKLILRKTK